MIDLRGRYPIALAWPRLPMVLSAVEAIVIHHSVTPTLPATATRAEEIAWLDAIHAHHIGRGFGGIGYHLCVFPSGRVYYVSSLRQWGAGVYRRNNSTLHICLVGDCTTAPASQGHLLAAAEATDFIDQFLKEAA